MTPRWSATLHMIARRCVEVVIGCALLGAFPTLLQAADRTDSGDSVASREGDVAIVLPSATGTDGHRPRVPNRLVAARCLVEEIWLHRPMPGRARVRATFGVHGEDEVGAVPAARSTGRAPRPGGAAALTVARI